MQIFFYELKNILSLLIISSIQIQLNDANTVGVDLNGTWTNNKLISKLDASNTYFRSGSWLTSSSCVVVGGSTTTGVGGLIYYSEGSTSFSTWTQSLKNPSVLYQDIASFVSVSNSYYVAIDNKGNVSISIDQGVSWPKVMRISNKALNAIVINARSGVAWCVGILGQMYRSSNESHYSNWVQVSISWKYLTVSFNQTDLYGVTVLDGENLIIVGKLGFIARCYDSIASVRCWQISSSNISLPSVRSTQTLFGVSSLYSKIAIVSGVNGDILKTVDRGMTWKLISNISTAPNSNLGWLANVGSGIYSKITNVVSDETYYVIDTKGDFHVTRDGGLSWQLDSAIGEYNKIPLFISMYSSSLGLVGGSNGNVYTKLPTKQTVLPTSQPSLQPYAKPSDNPVGKPSCQPSVQPSTSIKFNLPTMKPTANPSSSSSPSISNMLNFPSIPPSFQPTTSTSYQFTFTGSIQNVTVPVRAYSAAIQMTGASGGSDGNFQGGKGGIISAIVKTTPGEHLHIYIGNVGQSRGSGVAYGGYNGGGNSGNTYGGGGGGASDIRLTSSLSSRFIVAGGGGGASYITNAGNAQSDSTGSGSIGSRANDNPVATGGTQTSGGSGGHYYNSVGSNGGLGYGGDGGSTYGGGGGSGYYGGGGGYADAGAGGSSFCDPTICTDTIYSLAPSFPLAGSVSITFYITPGPTTQPSTFPTFSPTVYSPPTVNPSAQPSYSPKPSMSPTFIPSVLPTTSSPSTPPTYIPSGKPTINPPPMYFYYTGIMTTYIVPSTCYKLRIDAYGAQGGSYNKNGGLGGFIQVNLTITHGSVLYINVGGQGNTLGYCNYSPGNGNNAGGYNGGGGGQCGGATGGGASDVRVSTSLFNRIVVSGGGGGGAYGNTGGSGGGLIGGSGGGSGGSQSSGGTATRSGYVLPEAVTGILGLGGDGAVCEGYCCGSAGGGGGGYYGGGGGLCDNSGGGGSSYFNSSYNGQIIQNIQGVRSGDGLVVITPFCSSHLLDPTTKPSFAPTYKGNPTIIPTINPTATPSLYPSVLPTNTLNPTFEPSLSSTLIPSLAPVMVPTLTPSESHLAYSLKCPSIIGPIYLNLTALADFHYQSCNTITSATIPSLMTFIGTLSTNYNYIYYKGDSSFSYCTRLTHVILNTGLKQLGNRMFKGSSLVTVLVPSTVTFIGDNVFRYCTKLSLVQFVQGIIISEFTVNQILIDLNDHNVFYQSITN